MACRCHKRHRDEVPRKQRWCSNAAATTLFPFYLTRLQATEQHEERRWQEVCTSVSLANSIACLFCCFFVFSGSHRLHCLWARNGNPNLLPIKNKAPGKDTFCNSFCKFMTRRICVSSVCAFCSSPLMEIRSGRNRLRRPSVRRDLLVLFASSLGLLSVALLATLMKGSREIRPRGRGGYRTNRRRNQVWQEDRVSDRPTSPSLRSQLAHQTCDEGGGGGVLQQLLMNPWYWKRLDMVPTQSSDMVLSFFFYRRQQLLFFPDL